MDNDRFSAGRAVAMRDLADLMVWPWFSLAKTPRHQPIRFEQGPMRLFVQPAGDLGIATIWDADVLVWAVSQLTEAIDAGRAPTRHLETPTYPLLRFLGRSAGRHDYRLLRAAFDRLWRQPGSKPPSGPLTRGSRRTSTGLIAGKRHRTASA